MPTAEQAVNHVIGKGYRPAAAQEIVEALGPDVALAANASIADVQKAVEYVKSCGYSQQVAQDLVQKIGAHIVLAGAALHKDSKRPMWDPHEAEEPGEVGDVGKIK